MAIATDTRLQSTGLGRAPGLQGWMLLSPLLLWLAIFVIVPTAILIVYSFGTSRGPARVDPNFSLDGYKDVFTPTTLRIFWRSIYYAAITTAVCVVVGYPVAYFIGRAPPRWRNRLLLLVMIPFWTSFMIRTYSWILILQDNGLMNSALRGMGLPFSIDMLGQPSGELLGLIYSFLPFMILPIYTSVEKLDNAMIEAAFDLGAGPVRAFGNVIVPLTRPGIVAGILLVFIPAIGTFAITDVLGRRKRDLIGNLIERQFVGRGGDWPYGSALGVILLLIFVICFWLSSRRSSAEFA